jgi:dolichol kinase
MLAILVLAVADPAAAVVGQWLGGRRVGTGSISGTVTFSLVATAILYVGTGRVEVVFIAVAVALLETFPGLGDDNLVIPLSTGILLGLWTLLIGGG